MPRNQISIDISLTHPKINITVTKNIIKNLSPFRGRIAVKRKSAEIMSPKLWANNSSSSSDINLGHDFPRVANPWTLLKGVFFSVRSGIIDKKI